MHDRFYPMHEVILLAREVFQSVHEVFLLMHEVFYLMARVFQSIDEVISVMRKVFSVIDEVFLLMHEVFQVIDDLHGSCDMASRAALARSTRRLSAMARRVGTTYPTTRSAPGHG